MPNDASALGAWQQTRPGDAQRWLASAGVPWWIAGGWAIDLFLGRATRLHGDLDVGILRRDVPAVLRVLSSWEIFTARDGRLTPLGAGHLPPADVHGLWCRPAGAVLWALELLLEEAADDDWVFRRERAVRRPLATVMRRTPDGLAYLAPEIQLLYKAKHSRARDHDDYQHAHPLLDAPARQWLHDALTLVDAAHPWIPTLVSKSDGARDNRVRIVPVAPFEQEETGGD